MEAGVKRNTKRVGDIAELAVMAALARSGYRVAIPFGEDNRYDLIIDKDGVLARVQVKCGRLRRGSVIFNCYSSHTHRRGVSCRRYHGEVEYFAIYCAELDRVYLVPAEEVDVVKGFLRVQPTKNKQAKNVRWADAYLVAGIMPSVGTAELSGVPVQVD